MNARASLVFYNEIDPFAAAWLEQLIAAGALPAGVVDHRDIRDIRPDELAGFDQCHFFAGIGGWPLALRYAGLEGMSGVWTGSCPCQSFSTAGRRLGFADERHLWPSFFHLIDQCRPRLVVGEQVASKLALEWLDLVHDDLEGAGYAVGAADLCAASVGAPHIRQRLFWCASDLADTAEQGWREQPIGAAGAHGRPPQEPRRLCDAGTMAYGFGPRLEGCDARTLGHEREAAERGDETCALVNAEGEQAGLSGCTRQSGSAPWSDLLWLPCRDGKARPTQPGLQPLAHGVSNRVGTLRGAGNAIVPQLAAEFVRAAL